MDADGEAVKCLLNVIARITVGSPLDATQGEETGKVIDTITSMFGEVFKKHAVVPISTHGTLATAS